ncbi:MAG: 8-oxoguanine DNA glycosylase [Candidatus Micrarchaeia archaeon]
MPVMEIPVTCFNLHHTMLSGQPVYFLMNYENGRAEFLVNNSPVSVEQIENSLKVEWRGESEEVKKVVEYRFRLKDDMKLIYKKIIKDEFMLNAVRELYGLRLTLSNPWETLACFICSTNNNLKNIKCIVSNLSSLLGEKVVVDGRVFHRFPTPEKISEADLGLLKKCKLGFRAGYLKNAARMCLEKIDLGSLAEMSYEEGRMELMRVEGVGEKIADCVMLFAYGKLEAFPVDVWVRKTMKRVYFKGKKATDLEIREFARNYWGEYAGYAQQYVYRYGRATGL